MSRTSEPNASEELRFSGRVTASVSHELKNVLATMSETAGLLSDLIELGDSGRPLNPAELRGCAETIVGEVKRGFQIVKNLNRFAHSADEPLTEVDLDELVALMVALASYLSYASEVEHKRSEGAGPRVMTRPLLLEDLLYRALVHVFKAVGPKGSIDVTTRSTPQGGAIVVSGLRRVDTSELVTEDVERIMSVLNASIEVSSKRDELQILVSRLVEAENEE